MVMKKSRPRERCGRWFLLSLERKGVSGEICTVHTL